MYPHTGIVHAKDDLVTCPCPNCGVISREGPRINEGHVGIRFDDWRASGKWEITLDGEPVTDRCTEALAGENGWAILFVNETPRDLCPELRPPFHIKTHPCTNLYWGKVEIRLTQTLLMSRTAQADD